MSSSFNVLKALLTTEGDVDPVLSLVTLPLHPLISTDMWCIMVSFVAVSYMVQQTLSWS